MTATSTYYIKVFDTVSLVELRSEEKLISDIVSDLPNRKRCILKVLDVFRMDNSVVIFRDSADAVSQVPRDFLNMT